MPSDPRLGKTLIGITGGIGSGKSLASHYFELLGYKVINADSFTKELYRTNAELKAKLVDTFGKEILDENGYIGGAEARRVIFSDSDNIKRVNEIVHPFVISAIEKEISKLKSDIVYIESAIAFESGFYKRLDYIVMVSSPAEERIKRVMMRDGAKKEDVERLMSLQSPEEEKIKLSDFVLKNNGKKIELKKAVADIAQIIEHIVKGKQKNA